MLNIIENQEEYWTPRNGKPILISKMGFDHIINVFIAWVASNNIPEKLQIQFENMSKRVNEILLTKIDIMDTIPGLIYTVEEGWNKTNLINTIALLKPEKVGQILLNKLEQKQTKELHLYMDKEDFEIIDEMAKGWGCTLSEAIKRLIRKKY
jgi:hypothetical protein